MGSTKQIFAQGSAKGNCNLSADNAEKARNGPAPETMPCGRKIVSRAQSPGGQWAPFGGTPPKKRAPPPKPPGTNPRGGGGNR